MASNNQNWIVKNFPYIFIVFLIGSVFFICVALTLFILNFSDFTQPQAGPDVIRAVAEPPEFSVLKSQPMDDFGYDSDNIFSVMIPIFSNRIPNTPYVAVHFTYMDQHSVCVIDIEKGKRVLRFDLSTIFGKKDGEDIQQLYNINSTFVYNGKPHFVFYKYVRNNNSKRGFFSMFSRRSNLASYQLSLDGVCTSIDQHYPPTGGNYWVDSEGIYRRGNKIQLLEYDGKNFTVKETLSLKNRSYRYIPISKSLFISDSRINDDPTVSLIQTDPVLSRSFAFSEFIRIFPQVSMSANRIEIKPLPQPGEEFPMFYLDIEGFPVFEIDKTQLKNGSLAEIFKLVASDLTYEPLCVVNESKTMLAKFSRKRDAPVPLPVQPEPIELESMKSALLVKYERTPYAAQNYGPFENNPIDIGYQTKMGKGMYREDFFSRPLDENHILFYRSNMKKHSIHTLNWRTGEEKQTFPRPGTMQE